MHRRTWDDSRRETLSTGVEIAGKVKVRFDLLKGKQGAWPVSETEDAWIAHATTVEYRTLCARPAGEWGPSLEEAFILLSIRASVARACKPPPLPP